MAEKFIQQPKLNMTKSMPSLMGINLDGIKPYQSYSSAIGQALEYTDKLVSKVENISQNNEVARIKSELDDLYNATARENLTDPNIYNTKEGREKVTNAINDMIEKQKEILSSSNVKLTKDRQDELIGYFKKNTQSNLMSIQTNLNNGMIKETTDDVLLSTEKSVMMLSTMDNVSKQDELIESTLKQIKDLETFGIKTERIQLDFINKSQSAIIDKMINTDIINNRTSDRYYKTTDGGAVRYVDGVAINLVKDAQGNPMIDPQKQLKDLIAKGKILLSDEACMDVAKSMNKITGIDVETAFSFIRDGRKSKWIKASNALAGTLSQEQALNEQKEWKLAQAQDDAERKALSDYRENISKANTSAIIKAVDNNPEVVAQPTLTALDSTYQNTEYTISEIVYGDTSKNLYSKGYTVNLLQANQASMVLDYIKPSDVGGINMASLDQFGRAVQSLTKKPNGQDYPDYGKDFIYDEIARKSNIPLLNHSSVIKSLSGDIDVNDTTSLTQLEARQLLDASQKTANPTTELSDWTRKYAGKNSLFLSGGLGADETNLYLYKYLVSYGGDSFNEFRGLNPKNNYSPKILNDRFSDLTNDEKAIIINLRNKIQGAISKQERVLANPTSISYELVGQEARKREFIKGGETAYKKNIDKLIEKQQEYGQPVGLNKNYIQNRANISNLSNVDFIKFIGNLDLNNISDNMANDIRGQLENRRTTLTEEEVNILSQTLPITWLQFLE